MVELGNTYAFTEVIQKFVNNRELVEKIGKDCKTDLDEKLNWNTIAKQIADVSINL